MMLNKIAMETLTNIFQATGPFWYSLTAALVLWAIKSYVGEKRKQQKEFKYLHYLVISTVHASEKVLGDEWKGEQQKKFDELAKKESFVNHSS